MSDRGVLAQDFLSETDWAKARSSLLAGDASNRKYFRLVHPERGDTAVLMDAPPDKGEDVRPFIRVAEHLRDAGLSAPAIYATDLSNGFLLLEDLGDALFARAIPQDPALEPVLYAAATDALILLHSKEPPADLAPYDPGVMAELAALVFDWYAPGADRQNPDAGEKLRIAIQSVLAERVGTGAVLIQRDYHAENLLWLPDRDGVARVGLLDFQDAMLGHPAYDLVSLLQDARRDVPAEIETAMVARYVTATGVDPVAFETAYRCLGVQRNLRILGVFARLCLRDGKPGYLDLIPRVWAHLQDDLVHPALAPVAEILSSSLPAPTPDILRKLKDRCATVPAQ